MDVENNERRYIAIKTQVKFMIYILFFMVLGNGDVTILKTTDTMTTSSLIVFSLFFLIFLFNNFH